MRFVDRPHRSQILVGSRLGLTAVPRPWQAQESHYAGLRKAELHVPAAKRPLPTVGSQGSGENSSATPPFQQVIAASNDSIDFIEWSLQRLPSVYYQAH